MFTFHTSETIPDLGEIPLVVSYTFHRGLRGSRDRFGVPEEPDDPDEIEIVTVSLPDGTELEPAPKIHKSLEEKCWDDLGGRAAADA